MDEAGGDGQQQQQQLGFVAGVIERERILGFERMLWRISRGNVFLRQADIEKPFTDVKTVKTRENFFFFVWILYFSFSNHIHRARRFTRTSLLHSSKASN